MNEVVVLEASDPLVETPTSVPAISATSLARFDAAVDTIEAAAKAYVCASDADYEAGGAAVARIRKLDTLFEDTFRPIKQWWDARKKETLDDERARRTRLDTSKGLFSAGMLAFKKKQDEAVAIARRAAEDAAKREAEARRLAEAEAADARAKAAGDQRGRDEAMAMLDRPLEIAPTFLAPSVPKLTGGGIRGGVKVVKQMVVAGKFAFELAERVAKRENRPMTAAEWDAATVIKGQDLEDLILCVAASRVCYDMDAPAEVKAWLQQFARRTASQAFLEAVPKALRQEADQRGETFDVGGVVRVFKERLG